MQNTEPSGHRPSARRGAEPKGLRENLSKLRHALLALHKTLVDSERASYEKVVGKIQSPNHFLKLLTSDPWFAWLHPLSQLVVAMDEALDAKEPLTPAVFDALVKQANRLLVPSENDDGYSGHYYEAMQRDPDVVLAHAAVVKLRDPRKT